MTRRDGWWGEPLPPFDPYRRSGGIYIVQFPDCVKVGRTGGFDHRLGEHLRSGGTSFITYHVPVPRDLRTIEDHVLRDVRGSGARVVHGLEWFQGRTFEQIAWTVERTIYRLTGTIELAASVNRDSP